MIRSQQGTPQPAGKEIKCRLYVMELKTVSVMLQSKVHCTRTARLSLNARFLISVFVPMLARALGVTKTDADLHGLSKQTHFDAAWKGNKEFLSIINRDHACAYETIVAAPSENTFFVRRSRCGWRRIEKFNFRKNLAWNPKTRLRDEKARSNP